MKHDREMTLQRTSRPSRAMKRLRVAQNGRQTAAIYSHSSLLYSVGILGGTTACDS